MERQEKTPSSWSASVALTASFLVLLSFFASAACQKAEPSTDSTVLDFGESDDSKTAGITAYVEAEPGSQCIIDATVDGNAKDFLAVQPRSITHEGEKYGIYAFTINATRTGRTYPGEVGKITFRDRLRGSDLFAVQVALEGKANLSETGYPDIPECGNESAANLSLCRKTKVNYPATQPGLLEKNWQEMMIFLGVFLLFVIIIVVFFSAIGGR